MTPLLASDTTGAVIWFIVLAIRIAIVATAIPAIISIAVFFKTRSRFLRRRLGLWLAAISAAFGFLVFLWFAILPSESVTAVDWAVMLVPFVTGFKRSFCGCGRIQAVLYELDPIAAGFFQGDSAGG